MDAAKRCAITNECHPVLASTRRFPVHRDPSEQSPRQSFRSCWDCTASAAHQQGYRQSLRRERSDVLQAFRRTSSLIRHSKHRSPFHVIHACALSPVQGVGSSKSVSEFLARRPSPPICLEHIKVPVYL